MSGSEKPLRVQLFGKPAVLYKGTRQPRVPKRCLAMLAVLALDRSNLDRTELALKFWPNDGRERARTNVRRHLHVLRTTLNVGHTTLRLLKETHGNVAIDWSVVSVDVAEFLEAAESQDHRRALDLYRGPILDGVFEDAILEMREQFRLRFIGVLSRALVDASTSRNVESVISLGNRLTREDPWNEGAVRELMAAHYSRGERALALTIYDRLAKTLAEDLQAEPAPATRSLRNLILSSRSHDPVKILPVLGH